MTPRQTTEGGGPAYAGRCARASKVNVKIEALLLVGLVLVHLFADTSGHFAISGDINALLLGELGINGRMLFLIGLGASACLIAAFPARFLKANDALSVLYSSGGVLAVVLYCMGASSGHPAQSTLACAVVGPLFIGCTYGWFEARMFYLTAKLCSLHRASTLCMISLIVKACIDYLLGLCPYGVQLAFLLCLPPTFWGIQFWLGQFAGHARPTEAERLMESFGRRQPNVPTMMALLVLSSVLQPIARSLSMLGTWGSDFVSASGGVVQLAAALGLFSALAAIVFHKSDAKHAARTVIVGLFILTSGFCALLLLMGSQWLLSGTLTSVLSNSLDLFSHALWMYIILMTCCMTKIPVYRVWGISEGSLSLVGSPLFFLYALVPDTGRIVLYIALYLVVVVVFWIMWRREPGGSVSSNAREADTPSPNLEELCRAYGLSARERDVFLLLAQGRSRAFIAQQLMLSEGTVKIHIGNIYKKTGVNNKQELITLARDWASGLRP